MDDESIKTLQRSIGITPSERYLQRLCERSFLRLWSYPGIYRDQSSGGGRAGGKELCDLLVLFDNHVLIFSDKDCKFPDTGNPKLDWNRWVKRAILKSADQLYGAERWIMNHPDRLFLDRNCKIPFPFPIPNVCDIKIHRLLIAHGVSTECRKYWGGSGSMMIVPEVIGERHLISENEKGFLFAVGQINAQKGFVHILDDTTVNILLNYLDTITDFVRYLEKKEKFIKSSRLIAAAGEEELLGYYLKNLNDGGEHDFIIDSHFDAISIDEGIWEDFLLSPQRKAQFEANIISYSWDKLIELFSTHAIQRTQYFPTNDPIADTEKVLRFMAREPRTRRRMLSKSIYELLHKYGENYKAVRVSVPQEPGEPYYVFLLFPNLGNVPEHEYREVRRMLLSDYCMVVKLKFPGALDIIGFATESGLGEYRSEDACYFDMRDWNTEMEEEAKRLHEEYGLLAEMSIIHMHEDEFPIPRQPMKKRHRHKSRHNELS
ncbi:MAG: hypothetical protein AAGU75_14225 [Bacillota bacterium]